MSPGRFLEFTEHRAAAGMEAVLELAVRESELRSVCVRREGDDVLSALNATVGRIGALFAMAVDVHYQL